MPQTIIDSHIHLWPASAANPASHRWMQPGSLLTKQYSVRDYKVAVASASNPDAFPVAGFIYVESDRTIGPGDDAMSWAAEPLSELSCLRRIVESELGPDVGSGAGDGRLINGIVAWAPLDRGLTAFRQYIHVAELHAGKATWAKVCGFRFLLQGITDRAAFRDLVEDQKTVNTLREFASSSWAFDVGVDQRQVGTWQLEMVADLIERVHDGLPVERKVVFVLNHLCKPNMEHTQTIAKQKDDFDCWKSCIQRLSNFENVYMKLSGAFSELEDQSPAEPWPVDTIVQRIMPWVQLVLDCFTPERVMFGSDWPVCNVRGPGDKLSWGLWRDVVDQVLKTAGLSRADMDKIWRGTVIAAYSLDNRGQG